MTDATVELIRELTEASGVPGYEQEVLLPGPDQPACDSTDQFPSPSSRRSLRIRSHNLGLFDLVLITLASYGGSK